MSEQHVSARRAGVDIGLQLVGRIANVALGIAVTLVLIRALGDTGFGQWSTIFAVIQIAGYFGDLGLQQIAVRKAAEEPEREARWIGALFGLRLALAVPTLALTVAILLVISNNADMRVSGVVLAVGVPVGALSALSGIYQLRVRNAVTAGYELANGILWGAAVFVLAAIDGSMIAFAVAFSAVQALTIGGQALAANRLLPVTLRGSRDSWPELIRVGIPVAVSGLLIISYGRIDQVLVYELDGERGAGLYGAAYRIVDRAQLLPATIMATIFPLMAAAYPKDPARVRRLAQAAIDLLLILALPMFTFTLAASGPLVTTLLGAEFAEAETTLVILMATYVLTCVGYLCGFVIIVLALQRRFVKYASAGLVLNVVLNVALIPSYGFVAAAWVILLTQVLVIGLSLRAILQGLEQRLEVGRMLRIAAAAGAMGAVVALSDRAGVPLLPLVGIGAAVYAAVLLGLRAITQDEIALLTRRDAQAS